MAIDFPTATTVGQTYTDPTSGNTYVVTVVGPPAQWVGSGSSTSLDNTYLRKDASNDPVTGTLTVTPATNVEGLVVTQPSGNSAAAMRITNEGSGNSFLVEDAASTDSSPFVIANDGKVGIGTTNPQYLLSVDTIGEVTSTNGTQVKGRTNANSIPTGYIGEVLRGDIDPNAQPALNAWTLMSNFAPNITAGQWLIWVSGYIITSTGITKGQVGISMTSTTVPDEYTLSAGFVGSTVNNTVRLVSAPRVYNLASTSTLRVFAARGDSGFGDFFLYRYHAVRIG